jgi:hypothetical protein
MKDTKDLSRIEHNLLSMQVDDIEPLFILYADTNRDVEGATLELILKALVKLARFGLSQVYIVDTKYKLIPKITFKDLKQRFKDLPKQEWGKYPEAPEYYFEITEKGRQEEPKPEYDVYYPK